MSRFPVAAAALLVACARDDRANRRPPDEPRPGVALTRGAAPAASPPAPAGWSRQGPRLTYRTPGGRALAFVDDSTEGARWRVYQYLGPIAGTAYALVGRGYYEGGDYLLVHLPTGATAELPNAPVLAPDRQRVVAASTDFEAGELPIQLDVWRLANDGAVREYTVTPGASYPAPSGWGPSDPRWLDAGTVEFTKYVPTADGAGRTSRARLVLSARGWRVVERPAS